MANQIIPIALCLVSTLAVAFSWGSCGEVQRPTVADSRPSYPDTTTETLKAAGYDLRIEINDGKCVINYDGPHKGKLNTDLLAPCDFVRNRTDGLQSFEYRKTLPNESYTTILLIGGPVDRGRSDKFMKQGCGTRTQAISLSPRGVAVGGIGDGLQICPSDQVDEKMFGSIAKPT